MIISVFFNGRPGDNRDELCQSIIANHDGKVIGAGTFLPTSERDVQAELPEDRGRGCMEALRNRGFEVEQDK